MGARVPLEAEGGVLSRENGPQSGGSSSAIPDASTADRYRAKIEQEIENYRSVENVHDLPGIAHYWANKYLLPKVREFGFDDARSFYCAYLRETCQRDESRTCRFMSVGAGNCDLEAGIAETLVGSGTHNFVLECLDLNEHMLQRGQKLAEEKGIFRNLAFTRADINQWQPSDEYQGIIVNQALHHFLELERLFGKIYDALDPRGYFLTDDMIGRNGHMRWPEALVVVNELWKELPLRCRYNHQLKRLEVEYENWDCSREGFEGIRSQDILPLLVESEFSFDLFFAFGNVIEVFISRGFGHNYDVENERDRAFIDRVAEVDEELIERGHLKPTHMMAALTKRRVERPKVYKHLTPAFCVRWLGGEGAG